MRKAVPSASPAFALALLLVLVLASCAGLSAPLAGSREALNAPAAGRSATPPAPATSVELVSGAIYQRRGSRLFLARPRGGIVAIDAATGGELWSRETAHVPLLAADGRLLARRAPRDGGLELAILDAESGDELATLRAALPEGVVAPLDHTAAVSFEVSARWQEGEAIVDWRYLERWAAALPADATSPFARQETGSLRVDLERARLVGRSSGEADPELAARAPDRAAPAGTIEPPFDPVASLPAADGRTVSYSRRLEASALERYEWAILDAEDGGLLGTLRASSSAAPFVVHGDLVVVVERPFGQRIEGRWEEVPYRVRARRLAGGEEVWAHPLRWTEATVVPPAGGLPPPR